MPGVLSMVLFPFPLSPTDNGAPRRSFYIRGNAQRSMFCMSICIRRGREENIKGEMPRITLSAQRTKRPMAILCRPPALDPKNEDKLACPPLTKPGDDGTVAFQYQRLETRGQTKGLTDGRFDKWEGHIRSGPGQPNDRRGEGRKNLGIGEEEETPETTHVCRN
jgi:hypothetical protein